MTRGEILSKYQRGNPLKTRLHRPFDERIFDQANLDSYRQEIVKAMSTASEEFCRIVESFGGYLDGSKYRRFREGIVKGSHEWDQAWYVAKFSHASILRTVDNAGTPVFIYLTQFIAAEAGGYGVIKIGFIIDERTNDYRIRLDQPRAIKLLYGDKIALSEIRAAEQKWREFYPKETLKYFTRVSQDAEKHYMVLPLLRGFDLGYFLDFYGNPPDIKSNQLNFIERLNLCLAIIDALEKFHEKNIVHLDLKPENIMVARMADRNFSVEFVDLDKSKKVGEWITSELCGTDDCYLPEVVRRNKTATRLRVDFSQDIFTLGIILAEIFVDKGTVADQKGTVPEQQGILLTRAKHLAARSKPDFQKAFDTILPDVEYLKSFNWLGIYKITRADQISREFIQFAQCMYRMLEVNPSERPKLGEIKTTFTSLKERMKLRVFPGQCVFVTQPTPTAAAVVVSKRAKPARSPVSAPVSPVPDDTRPLLPGGEGCHSKQQRKCFGKCMPQGKCILQ